MEKEKLEFLENDLGYEFRMILGASKLVKLFDEKEMGNACSLLRDSVYLHARNLYNFFSGNAKYDYSVHEFINYDFDLRLYRKWKKSLHRHVLHIQKARKKGSNVQDGEKIDKVAICFAKDIDKLWDKWIMVEDKEEIKRVLLRVLKKAITEANDDYNNMMLRILDENK